MTNANGDRSIARRALVEGDASLASIAYVRQGPLDQDTVQRFTEQVAMIPEELRERHPNVPETVRASLAFQYNTGSVFAAAAYLRGGWPAVDAAEADPPTSSEQVLHPEKYFDARENPRVVTLGGLDELERRGWTRVLEDTFGELDVPRAPRPRRRSDPRRRHRRRLGRGPVPRARARRSDDRRLAVGVGQRGRTRATSPDNVPQAVAGAHVERRDARVLVLIAPARRPRPRRADLGALADQRRRLKRPSRSPHGPRDQLVEVRAHREPRHAVEETRARRHRASARCRRCGRRPRRARRRSDPRASAGARRTRRSCRTAGRSGGRGRAG
jgi:hypothetical protein